MTGEAAAVATSGGAGLQIYVATHANLVADSIGHTPRCR
jgi:hypothetical protein